MKTLGILTFFILVAPIPLWAQAAPGEPNTLVRKYVHFTKSDETAMNRGGPAAKLIDSSDPSEMALFGVVRVKISGASFVDRFRDIANFKKSKEILQIGTFHSPPNLDDLESLTLDPEDVAGMKECRVGNCKLKLSGPMIERLHTEVDWKSADYQAQVTRLYRKSLIEYLAAYLEKGNEALVAYEDKQGSSRLADETRGILQASPYLTEYAPDLLKYLHGFPKSRPQAAEDLIYWSKEKFGFKAVISITHVTIYRPAGSPWVFIASKQIYADHYFLGSLGLTLFLDPPEADRGSGGFLMYFNRSRVDVGGGISSGVLRFFVKRRILDGLDKYLRLAKERLESANNASGVPPPMRTSEAGK